MATYVWEGRTATGEIRKGEMDASNDQEVMNRLRDAGIGSQVHYMPLHLQPYYQQRYGEQSLPGAEAYYRRALSLPLHAGMTQADVARVVSALETAFEIQPATA